MRLKSWYAAHVRSNQEQVVSSMLAAKGLESYVPSFRESRQWSDRIREIDRPLFPGYVFCRMNPEDRIAVQMTIGVVKIVGIGKQPAPIEDSEMETIQLLAAAGVRQRPCDYLEVGDEVHILGGPLSGMTGILQQVKTASSAGRTMVVSISLLRRSIAVELQDEWVVVNARRQPSLGSSVSLSSGVGRQL